jgi:hypothetical protein
MKRHITILTIIIVVTTFLSTGCMYAKQKKIIWDTTIGTIYEIHQGGRFSRISYIVNGKLYKDIVGGLYEDVAINEKFIIYYDRNRPKKTSIDFTRPVFEKGEDTLFRIGKIIKIEKQKYFFTTSKLRFGFKIHNGHIIKKWVELPDNYEELYPNLKEGQYYYVVVWKPNAYRCVLRLDLGIVEDI